VVNTAVTYLLYLVLLQVLPYVEAYSMTYLAGIFLGYMLNSYVVFKERPTLKSVAMYPLVYVLNYLFGLSILYTFVELFGVPREMAPLFVIAISVPVAYISIRFVFKGSRNEKILNK